MKTFLSVLLFVGKRITIFTFAILILSSFACVKDEACDLSSACQNLYEKVGLAVQSRGPICCIGKGIYKSLNDKIDIFSQDFQISQTLTFDEARELIISVVEDSLRIINNDTFSSPWLEKHPFNYESLKTTIFIVDSMGDPINHPNLCLVQIRNGKVNFKTQTFGYIPEYVDITEEPFEEAYFKVRGKKFHINEY